MIKPNFPTPLPQETEHSGSGDTLVRKGGLKNVFLVNCNPPRLYETATGEPVPAFNLYSRSIHKSRGKKRADSTNQQYVWNNTGLMDYLYECRALGAGPINPDVLNETLDSYHTFLTEGINSDDYIIRTVARRLGRTPICVRSALKLRAAANDLLRRHAAVLRDSLAKAKFLNPEATIEPVAELAALNDRQRSGPEIEKMRTRLMEFTKKSDDVYLNAPGGIEGGRAPKSKKRKDFPSEHLLTLLENLPPLEKTAALLQCGGSLRQSEVWLVRKSDIDVKLRTIRIDDPDSLRDPSGKKLPYKGRNTANIYMFAPFDRLFFQAYANYLSVRPTSDSDFLFVSDRAKNYGTALIESHQPNSLNRRLNRALAKAQLKNSSTEEGNKKPYASHSLRHFYGYWTRNFVYIPGRPSMGLTLAEIQVLMGHADPISTLTYAKLDGELMMAEISASRELSALWNTTNSIDSLRADAYEALAQDLRSRLKND